jgi:hypothetical protein
MKRPSAAFSEVHILGDRAENHPSKIFELRHATITCEKDHS